MVMLRFDDQSLRIQRLSYALLIAGMVLSLQLSLARNLNFSIAPRYEFAPSVPDLTIGRAVDFKIEDAKLRESYTLLENSITGRNIARMMVEKRVHLVFGYPRTQGMAAVYIPASVPLISSGTIMIGYDYKDTPANVLAALIAHEAVHAQYDSFFGEDTVAQEYEAYMAQATVWKEVRKTISVPTAWYDFQIHETNPENDFAVSLSEMSKTDAYKLIHDSYFKLGVELSYN